MTDPDRLYRLRAREAERVSQVEAARRAELDADRDAAEIAAFDALIEAALANLERREWKGGQLVQLNLGQRWWTSRPKMVGVAAWLLGSWTHESSYDSKITTNVYLLSSGRIGLGQGAVVYARGNASTWDPTMKAVVRAGLTTIASLAA